MKEEKNHIIYTAEDIKRYITGEMPPAAMHAMEMAALDDPLLAEAMEGYDLMEQKDWSKELAALKQTFDKSEKEAAPVILISKTSSTKWWRAAAAILVLGATATTAYIFTNKSKPEAAQELAKVTTPAPDSITIAKADSAATFFYNNTADSSQQLIAKLDKGTAATFSTATAEIKIPATDWSVSDDAKQTADSDFIYKPSPNPGYLAMKDKQAIGETDNERQFKAQADVTTTTPGVASNNAAGNYNGLLEEKELLNKRETSVQNNQSSEFRTLANKDKNNSFGLTANTFYGAVVTADNKPVSYANVLIPQSKKRLYTDANGNFSITAPDTALKITITSAGFNTQKFTLQNSIVQNKIVMQQQDLSTEILASSTNGRAKRAEAVRVDSTDIEEEEDAEPSGGWVAYDSYLSNNLVFPEDAKQKNIHGEVEVTVKLKNNGEISTVKIDKPLCAGCDAEAIRLVKEGPKFDIKNKKKTKVKVKVKF